MAAPTWFGRAPLHAAVISCCVLQYQNGRIIWIKNRASRRRRCETLSSNPGPERRGAPGGLHRDREYRRTGRQSVAEARPLADDSRLRRDAAAIVSLRSATSSNYRREAGGRRRDQAREPSHSPGGL